MVKPTNNFHCEAILIEAKPYSCHIPNRTGAECLINSKIHHK